MKKRFSQVNVLKLMGNVHHRLGISENLNNYMFEFFHVVDFVDPPIYIYIYIYICK